MGRTYTKDFPKLSGKKHGELFWKSPDDLPVRVRKEYSLTQLRFFPWKSEIAEIDGTTVSNILFAEFDGMLVLLASPKEQRSRQNAVAFCVHRDEDQ